MSTAPLPSPSTRKRVTPAFLRPQLYPDGRIVFWERDLFRTRRIAQAWIALVPCGLCGLLAGILIGDHVHTPWIEFWSFISLAWFVFASVLAASGLRSAPLNRSLVIDPRSGNVGIREAVEDKVVAEHVRRVDECRFVLARTGDRALMSWDRTVLACCVRAETGELRVALAVGAKETVARYIALLPPFIRERIVQSSEEIPVSAESEGNKSYLILNTMQNCRGCGYSLEGLEAARCPECGLGRWEAAPNASIGPQA